jgi:N-acetylglucosamine kinase-like BadF-type ATPase
VTCEGVVLVGVDAGATKSVALAVTPGGAVVGRASGEGANPKRHGLAESAARIAALALEASSGAGEGHSGLRPPALMFVAGAGIDRPEHARALEDELAERVPGARVMAANDTMAVLRCGTPDGVGLVVPVSTGGNVIGRGPDGRVTDRGHGIFGGGYVLGALVARAAVRGRGSSGARGAGDRGPALVSASSGDAVAEDRALASPEWAEAVDAAGLTWRGRRPDPSAARLAAAVAAAAEAGDPFPARIVDRWCGRVTAAVREEVERLGLGRSPCVVVYGGLLEASPWLGARIRTAILAGAPGARLGTLEMDPVEGAALLACDAWAGRLAPWTFAPRR